MGVQYVGRDVKRERGGHGEPGSPRPPDLQHRPGGLQEGLQISLTGKAGIRCHFTYLYL